MSNPGEIQPKDTSVDDDVRAAFASLKSDTPAVTETPVTAAPESREGETVEQAAQRARDEAGRFTKEPTVSTRVKAEGTSQAPQVTPTSPAAAPVAIAPVKAPDGWSAAAKAEFDKLPAVVQQETVRREQEMHKKFTSQDEDRTFGKSVKETLNPYMATIISEGGTPQQAINELFRTALVLRSPNPEIRRNAVLAIAQQFGVELNIPLQQGAQQPQAVHPQQVSALVQAEMNSWRQNQEKSELQREVETFASQPGHEHFETVKPIMAALLSSETGPKSLQEAYDQAVWANPDIRSTLTAAQLSEQESKRTTEAKASAERAKRASGSIAGGPGAAVPNGAVIERSLDEELRANFRAASGRV